MNIPPKCSGRRSTKETLIGRIESLPVGGFIEVPRAQQNSAYKSAAEKGIRIVTRRVGSTDTTRIYRVEASDDGAPS